MRYSRDHHGAFWKIPPLAAAAAVVFAGCGEKTASGHPLWARGRNAEREGDYAAAAECFSRLARIRPEDAPLHLKLAELYDERLDDPFRAAEEYAVLLEVAPDHPEAELFRRLLRRARRKACDRWIADLEVPGPDAALPGSGVDPERELILLRRENALLAAELRRVRSPEAMPPVPAAPPIQAAPPVEAVPAPAAPVPETAAAPPPAPAAETAETPRYYTVKAGDTPEKISRAVYGTGRYAGAILEANRETVRSARELRIGQRLILPEINE